MTLQALQKSSEATTALINTTYDLTLQRAPLGNSIPMAPAASFSGLLGGGNRRSERTYQRYHGWLYSAINALASEGAEQEFRVGRITNATPNPENRSPLLLSKSATPHEWNNIPGEIRSKAADQQIELLIDSPLIDALSNPNPMQGAWQFVYSFIANLNLTGWGYVVGGETDEGKLEFYSLPTTWVKPDHTNGPFSAFRIVDPDNPQQSGQGELLTREQVAFAHLPNPSDPRQAFAPANAQMTAIRVDDHIQTSQEMFFENGIFPSVVVSIGRDPHPDVPGGIRPRLNEQQRRQIHAIIENEMGGVFNFGNPAIVDGLIESITRLSMSNEEMGWDKSEDKVANRILSAFAVHKFILGLEVSVGGYAQSDIIERRFCKRVNTFLKMLSSLMTNFAGPLVNADERTLIWWEPCASLNPELHWNNMREGRKNKDVTRNEFRAGLGLPAVEEEEANRSKLLDTVGGMTGAVRIFDAVGQGSISRASAAKLLALFFQIPEEQAAEIVGEEVATSQSLESLVQEVQALASSLKNPVRVNLPSLSKTVDAIVSQASTPRKERERLDETLRMAEALAPKQPIIHLNTKVDPTSVNVESPSINIEPTQVTVNTPEQAISIDPHIKIESPEVVLPEQPAPVVNVEGPTINVPERAITVEPSQVLVNPTFNPELKVEGITIEVPETQVIVNNQVDVDVPLPKKKSIDFKFNQDGEVEGLEIESEED